MICAAPHRAALDYVQSHATAAEDGDGLPRPNLGSVHGGAHAGHHPAADQAHLVQRRVVADLDRRYGADHGALGKRSNPRHAADVRPVFHKHAFAACDRRADAPIAQVGAAADAVMTAPTALHP